MSCISSCMLAFSMTRLTSPAPLRAHLVVRTNRYLNNVIEQGHRRIKQRVMVILGFKRFDHVVNTVSGIELVHQIKKGQFAIPALFSTQARTPQVWEAVQLPKFWMCFPLPSITILHHNRIWHVTCP